MKFLMHKSISGNQLLSSAIKKARSCDSCHSEPLGEESLENKEVICFAQDDSVE